MYRLLKNEADVVGLLDLDRHPFSTKKPPKFVRAKLYHYHFTNFTEKAASGKLNIVLVKKMQSIFQSLRKLVEA